MNESVSLNIEKLVSDKLEKGVVGSSLCLENRKLGDEGISKLANLEILSEVVCLELGENNISDEVLKVLCNSPYIQSLKTLNLKLLTLSIILMARNKNLLFYQHEFLSCC